MAFKKFNPCLPCCTKPMCSSGLYPKFFNEAVTESDYYFGMNVDFGDEYYNPITDEMVVKSFSEVDLLIVRTRTTTVPAYGYDEFHTWMNRGKSILCLTDYIGFPGVLFGPDYVTAAAILSGLGASDFSITPQVASYYQPIGFFDNIAAVNNVNENWSSFLVQAASTVSGGFTILESHLGIVLVGKNMGSNGGKLFLWGDQNGEIGKLTQNICALQGQPIVNL